MPCSDGGLFREEEEQDNRHMREGAELLCTFMRNLEKDGVIFLAPKKVQLWWAEHKRRDEARGNR